jgi:Sulfotransferase family
MASTEQPRVEPSAKRRAPDFFVVGHPKSGTTALHNALRRHPEIFMPREKEPWYLASEVRGQPARPHGHTPATMEEYLGLFADARSEQRVGEASPVYLWSRTAAASIAELRADARIIAILREPASFLRSLHLQFVQNYTEDQNDFQNAIELEDDRRAGRSIPPNPYWPGAVLYSDHVRYVEQLRRYEERFPSDQILVLIYDDFRADNEGSLRRVLRFIGVDENAAGIVPEVNPAVQVRSQRLYGAVHSVAGRQSVRRATRTLGVDRMRLVAIRDRLFYRAPAAPDEAFTSELRRRFKPEVQALSEHLGRDLVALWGYDRLD